MTPIKEEETEGDTKKSMTKISNDFSKMGGYLLNSDSKKEEQGDSENEGKKSRYLWVE